ncbi:MAG: hypothetical protein CSB19_00795 [Clostridiales bacterium]|nr:MAG: hypothetical protein CSB19_00795 [Clostridiales bacterium]
MILNIADVVDGRKREMRFDGVVVIDEETAPFNHNTDRSSAIDVKGRVYRSGDMLWIHMTYEGMVQFVCDRCLKPSEYAVSGELKRQLSNRDEFDVEWFIIRGGKVDLAQVIADDLVVELPIQLICSEDCKGLCPQCGVNRNEQSCQCESESIDPRLASLKNLFN